MKQYIISYPLGSTADPDGFGRSVDTRSFAKSILEKLHAGSDATIPDVFKVQVVDRPDLDKEFNPFILDWQKREIPFATITDGDGTKYPNIAVLNLLTGEGTAVLTPSTAFGRVRYESIVIKKPFTIEFK